MKPFSPDEKKLAIFCAFAVAVIIAGLAVYVSKHQSFEYIRPVGIPMSPYGGSYQRGQLPDPAGLSWNEYRQMYLTPQPYPAPFQPYGRPRPYPQPYPYSPAPFQPIQPYPFVSYEPPTGGGVSAPTKFFA